jgi:transcriptional regulator with XRE-family HTH domain
LLALPVAMELVLAGNRLNARCVGVIYVFWSRLSGREGSGGCLAFAVGVRPAMRSQRFGEVIRENRKARGLTQRELASALGITRSYVGAIEKNQRRPSLTILFRLARSLRLNALQMFVLAYPEEKSLVMPTAPRRRRRPMEVWRLFAEKRELLVLYDVTPRELRVLRAAAKLGTVAEPRFFLAILNSFRQALESDTCE